jgi:DNA-directed RNA polymerase subunit RPC12/RpoP
MTKVLDGWREKYGWERSSGDKALDALLDSVTSHEGWRCPHCGQKSTSQKEELSNQEYFDLIHDSSGEPLEMRCSYCFEKYFLKAYMVLKYSTCVDKDFCDE